jgi:outer membrane receptor for Fe3+-dicitrate
MVEARARVRKSGGVFIGREALAASGRTAMSDVLRRVPGVGIQHIATSGGTIAVLASSRGGAAQSALTPGVKYCPYQIFIDGARVYVSGEGEPPEIDTFVPSDYQGIEVYRGSAQTPPRYAGTGAVCGTVVFWSRAK